MVFAMIFADVDFPTFVTLPIVRIAFICIGEKILFVFWGFVRELEEKNHQNMFVYSCSIPMS